MDEALLSSVRMDWQTPDSFLRVVRLLDEIGLDPCTTQDNPVRARWFYTASLRESGLSATWRERGLVYANPPYGRALPRWIDKAAAEARAGAEIVLLVPSRTDTRWWHRMHGASDAVCFVRGRLRFVGAPGPAPFPSCVFYAGHRVERFARAFDQLGLVLATR